MSPNSLYNQHGLALWLLVVLLLLALFAWVMIVQVHTRKTAARLDDVFRGVGSENAAQMLADYLGTVRANSEAVKRMKREHDEMSSLMPSVIRHIGLVRFNPFHDTGGNQSFTLALLDGRLDGVVITALHSRSDSRLYAKPIEGGESEYALTPEEIEAMGKASGRSSSTTRASSA